VLVGSVALSEQCRADKIWPHCDLIRESHWGRRRFGKPFQSRCEFTYNGL